MSKTPRSITYRNNDSVRQAFLFNCRRGDLTPCTSIRRGDIVLGKHGYVVAEGDAPGVAGKTLPFRPNGKCVWKGQVLACMYLPGSPRKKKLKCMNYIVARVPDEKLRKLLEGDGVCVVPIANRLKLVTLECDKGPWQKNPARRATLL
jgi:hypothetical protein